ncbi:MAG: hypothetical protein OEZ36_12305, partial [Spirochaetota bacterium]|nr:hypothetical protein [Spirochaetota bacterium]
EKEAQSESYVVEISKTLDFKKIYQKKEFKTNKATLDLPVGVYFIRFYGVDENGDKTGYSPVRKVTLRYRANYTPIKQKDQHIAPKTFTLAFLEAENPKKQLYYSINNSKFKKYKGEAYSLDSGKKHSISYYFSDSKQVKTNKDSIKTLSLIVDDQAPTFSVTVGKKDFTKSDAINAPVDSVIKIKGQDKLSGLKEILYSYDNKKFFLYEYGIDVYDLEPFTIYFKLVDNVGNSTKIIKKKVLPVE